MKLLLLNDNGLQGGGAETRVMHLLDHWHRNGALQRLYVLQRSETGQPLQRPYLETLATSDKRKRTRWIAELCRTHSVDLVQAHNLLASGSHDFPVIAQSAVPLAWFVHDFWSACGNQLLCTTWNERCQGPSLIKCSRCIGLASTLRVGYLKQHFKNVDVGIVASRFLSDSLWRMGVRPKKWELQDPWIDLGVFATNAPRPDSPGNMTHPEHVLYVGPLSKPKGADLALEAFVEILKTRPTARLRMAGGEAHHGRWAVELGERFGIAASIDWLGRLSPESLAAEMRAAAVMVFPSRCQESFGLTWAQAMAARCPVVAIETGTIRELLAPNDLARVVPIDAGAIASAVITILENPSAARKQAQRAFEFTQQRLGVERAAVGLTALYRRMILEKAEALR